MGYIGSSPRAAGLEGKGTTEPIMESRTRTRPLQPHPLNNSNLYPARVSCVTTDLLHSLLHSFPCTHHSLCPIKGVMCTWHITPFIGQLVCNYLWSAVECTRRIKNVFCLPLNLLTVLYYKRDRFSGYSVEGDPSTADHTAVVHYQVTSAILCQYLDSGTVHRLTCAIWQILA